MSLHRGRFVAAIFVGVAALMAGLGFGGGISAAQAQEEHDYARDRRELVSTIQHFFATDPLPGLPRRMSKSVVDALNAVPRDEFVPAAQRRYAYENRPLPIGYGQTISQPYIVALMSELADLAPGDRVLEVGTGSGYQAAILAHMGADVHTIEIIPELGNSARNTLSRVGFDDVKARVGDGYFGWPEAAPFDAIVVTAAASHIPPPLTQQLAPGGRMVIPVGPPFLVQQLLLVTKDQDGTLKTRQLLPVRFVPLTRAE